MTQDSELHIVGTSTQKFGNVIMNVTTYNAPTGIFEGIQQNNVTISMGQVAGMNAKILVYDSVSDAYMKLVSATSSFPTGNTTTTAT